MLTLRRGAERRVWALNSKEGVKAIFKQISFIKLKLVSFFVFRYLTVSLRGPVLTLRRGRQPEFWVRKRTLKKKVNQVLCFWPSFFLEIFYCTDGTDGLDIEQKCPLTFAILIDVKHYIHIYLNIYKNIVCINFLHVLNFGKVGGLDAKV